MSQLIIRNIGPIKEISVPLNRVNIFIGPQSSGKSTIAKVISFCQWLEKDCVRKQRISHVDQDFCRTAFIDYHNIRGYISELSYFSYQGKALNIEFRDYQLSVSRQEDFCNIRVSKNAYIPSERNLISVPGIFQTKMPDNYILSFLSDWKRIRQKYSGPDSTELPPTGDIYYYDEHKERDMLRLPGGHEIELSQASSGLQSVTPLIVYINYVTDWIYTHHEEQSADGKEEELQAALANVMDSMTESTENGILDVIDSEAYEVMRKNFQDLLESLRNASEVTLSSDNVLRRIVEARDNLSRPNSSNLVIEEPEQNLFPETQRQLVEHILSHHYPKRDTLVLTTHSPFVLYSINNCMLAYLSYIHDPEGAPTLTDIPEKAYLNPEDVNVWELRGGYIEDFDRRRNKTIQDSRGLIRDNYFDRVMGNVMTDFRNMIGTL